MSLIPEIKPYNHDKYTSKQSQYDVVSELPTRSMLLGPTKSGKSIVLQNLILVIYRGAFEKIYIFSPSIHIDSVWVPVKKYLEKDLKQIEDEKNRYYFDTFDPVEFKKIITTQAKIIQHLKDRGFKKMYNIAIVIDDFKDKVAFMKRTPDLDLLFLRGRHYYISVFVSVQKFRSLSNVIRLNI